MKTSLLTVAAGLPVLTPDEMRAAEAAAIVAGTPALILMARAAAAAALAITRFCPAGAVLVLCGPGNNGGDGYGVACLLRAAGRSVRVAADGAPAGEAAGAMAARWGGPVEALASAAPAPVVVDALFGTGLRRALPTAEQAALDSMAGATVVAIDIASGVDALTGAALGRPLLADLTVTFGALKRGHVLGPGRQLSGRIICADIGLSVASITSLVTAPKLAVLEADTHKYRRGAVLVIEGDTARGGAARLAALAALRAGAGVVTLIGPDAEIPAEIPADAVMRRRDAEGLDLLCDPRTAAIAIGPGLAAGPRASDWLLHVLAGAVPVVADAGALALDLGGIGPVTAFAASRAPLVLTPHDGEFTRLFGPPGADRLAAARAAADLANAIIVLKGPETIIAAPGGRAAVNVHAAPWLATAGAGDVLTGIIAALIAQGLTPFDAAAAAVWLHGDAGLRGGPGLIADDLPALLPQVLAAL